MTNMNTEKPEQVEKRIKEPCSFFILNDETKQREKCPNEALSKCPLCLQMFCLDHRFEDQHDCIVLQQRQVEEEKKNETKTQLLDKIKAKAEQQQEEKRQLPQKPFQQVTEEKQLKALKRQQVIQRMKAKSSAKGDASVPRGNRFAFTVLFSEEL